MIADARYAMEGSARANNAMDRFMDNIANFKAIGPSVHRAFKRQVAKTFRTRGANIGERWPGYTAGERIYGIVKKAMLGNELGKRLLRWKPGREILYPSLISDSHPNHVWRVEGMDFVFGTSVPHAYKHNEGKGRGPIWAGRGRIQRRKFMGISLKTSAAIRRAAAKQVGI